MSAPFRAEEPSEPLSGLLDFIGPALVSTVGDEAAAAMREVARGLPSPAFRLVGLELPLNGPLPPADLLLQLAPAPGLRPFADVLQEFVVTRVDNGGGAHDARPCLDALERLIGSLTRSGHRLFGKVSDSWMEYDVGSGDGRLPSLFAGPSDHRMAPDLASLLGAGSETIRGLGDFLASLKPEECVHHLGVMHGREQRELRCLVTSATVPAPGLESLGLLGWSGNPSTVTSYFSDFGHLAPRGRSLGIAFDASGRVKSNVGLEFHLHSLRDAAKLLGRLTKRGLAVPATCRRILGWDGAVVDWNYDWTPSVFRSLIELTDERYVLAVIRRIHHVKLTVGSGGICEAKAYLGARPMLISRHGLPTPDVSP